MSIKDDAYPSSIAFEEIHRVLSEDDAARKKAINDAKGIFAFTLKNAKGQSKSWHIDLKETGKVATGDAPAGKKADVTMLMSDADFMKLVEGKAKAQQLFMSGKLKIKGNVMKATKLDPIINASRSKSKL